MSVVINKEAIANLKLNAIAAILFEGTLNVDGVRHVRVSSERNVAVDSLLGFFTAMGFLNWYLAFVLFKGDTSAWVSFKAFGSTAIMFVFIVGQTIYLSRHIKDQA